MRHYGVIIDPSMVRNVFPDRLARSQRTVDAFLAVLRRLLATLARGGDLAGATAHALASCSIDVARLQAVCLWRMAGWHRGPAVLSSRISVPRCDEHKGIRYQLTPGNVLWSAGRVIVAGDAKSAVAQRDPAEPAHRVLLAGTRKPTLLVMVVGETARAANFGLNGYARMNTPELAALDVINFPHVTSCGTSTEVSVPCMFSPFWPCRLRRGAHSQPRVAAASG